MAENHSVVRANAWFADVEKSIKFPLEIITLVSSANNIGSARNLFAMEGHLYQSKVVGALEWTLRGLRASIFPTQKVNYELNWVFDFYLLFSFC